MRFLRGLFQPTKPVCKRKEATLSDTTTSQQAAFVFTGVNASHHESSYCYLLLLFTHSMGRHVTSVSLCLHFECQTMTLCLKLVFRQQLCVANMFLL